MPFKASGPAEGFREIDRWDGGAGWIAHPEETMQRASHAVVDGGEVWVVDPVDAPGVDDLLADLGEVAGVAVLIDRHTRDAAEIARRHGVAVHVPAEIDGAARGLDAPVEQFRGTLGDTGFRARPVVDSPFWHEVALFDGETLVVADALGTADYFLVGRERLGVSPPLRLRPPRRRLGNVDPERVLVGHGAGVFEDAPDALRDALAGARRRIPRLYLKNLRVLLSG